jgi:hypothetical protein
VKGKSTARTTSARSKRTPVRVGGGGSNRFANLPWIPIVVVVGVAAVIGIVAYLIVQSNSTAESSTQWIEVEADVAPDLPGEHVDLQGIYEGVYGGRDGQNNTAGHVSRDVDYTEQGMPPAGGPHWNGACGEDPEAAPAFCGPAPWGVYRVPWDAETLVHNMEHGGVVIWYNTTDQAVIDQLEELVLDKLEGEHLVVLAPFPDMEEDSIAVTTWARRDLFAVSDFTQERVSEFIDVHDRRFNPEDF